MLNEENAFDDLYQKWLSGGINEEEMQRLDVFLRSSDYSSQIENSVRRVWNSVSDDAHLTSAEKKLLAQKIMAACPAEYETDLVHSVPTTHRVHFIKRAWFRYAVAVVLITGTIVYFKPFNFQRQEIAQNNSSTELKIVPGGNKAILTLADGRKIGLDSAGVGSLAQEGSTKIIKLDAGAITYQPDSGSGQIAYNTVTTPKGGQYRITLPDGSMVWLNAASSIRFPTSFHSERRVEITGECYLEVASDINKPFVVQTNETLVQVLGTSFNVNTYGDQSASKISLQNGSIKVGAILIKPGQAYLAGQVVATDLAQDLAWKNGLFNFRQTPITLIMKQIERWYDVEVVYTGSMPATTFTGELSRNTSLPVLLKILEDIGAHCRLAGRKIFVNP